MTQSRAETLVDQLTPEEQVSILSGEGFWNLPAIDRLGIGQLRVTDGPNGARGGGSLVGGVKSAAFPVGICIGASWNPDLARELGSALADEVKSKGAHVSLSPTVNIQRSVTNGRNFECYSEDPVLTAALAVGFVRGLQDKGIASTIKHFAGNESEIQRTTMSSDISERALRETYLLPFEAAVKEAGTWGVMSSYNKINGTYSAENHWLLTKVLRDDWGFDGVVVSDWFGSRSTEPTVNAGLDLEMPGPTRDRGDKLLAAVAAGTVPRETLRERALNILRLMERVGSLDDHRPHVEKAEDRPEHRALIRRAGAEGAVLLANNGILPLAGAGKGIAVIGPNARVAQIMGGGSAQLNPHYAVSPWDGLAARLGPASLSFAKGADNNRFQPVFAGALTAEFYATPNFTGPVVHSEPMNAALAFWIPPLGGGKVDPRAFSARVRGNFTATRTGRHRVGLFSAGYTRAFVDGKLVADAMSGWKNGRTFFEEGCDEVVGEVDMLAGQTYEIVMEFTTKPSENLTFSAFHLGIGLPLGDAAIAEAVAVARGAETAIVFAGRSGEWDTEGSDLLDIRLPGRQDELIAAVAAANPRTVVVLQTGGPVEMPWAGDVAAILQAWYPGQEAGNAIADMLLGDVEPSGRLAQTFPVRWQDNPAHSQDPEVYPGLDGHVRYAEGLFTGHRHYDKHGIRPLYPFGFGLGYSTFAINSVFAESAAPGRARVAVKLANTGPRDGATVVQVYVEPPVSAAGRPLRELKAFRKVSLPEGAETTLAFSLSPRDFAWFDEAAQGWRVEAGTYRIAAGLSAADLAGAAQVTFATGLLLPL